ncbi:MAG: ATP-binding protein [Eubacteriaceae bacterium]|nr:ATP-binding protein [Eubacteriaceae bacterium]
MKDEIYYETLQEFNDRINRDKLTHKKKIDELYEEIPQLKTIHEQLNHMGLLLVMQSMKSGGTEYLQKLKEEMTSLKKEETLILSSWGYPQDYLEIKPECSFCMDKGFVNNMPCRCFNKILIEKYYGQSNLGNILEKENFETFNINYYSDRSNSGSASPRLNIQNILHKSLKFIKDFETEYINLYMYGESGLGKTFLSHCIAKDLLDSGRLVIYQTASDLLDIIRKNKFNTDPFSSSATGPLSYLYTSDLLIIDDLGTEHLTDFANNELFNLINKRLKDEKKMIISTNLSLKELQARYSTRLASRIMGNFLFLHFFGDDIRLKKANIL